MIRFRGLVVSSNNTSALRIGLRRVAWALAVAALLFALVVLDFLRFGGWFSELPPATDQRCRSLPLSASSEDIQIDRSRGLAFLSLLDRRGLISGTAKDGDIGILDLNDPDAAPFSALGSIPVGFRPHGMSLYPMGDGSYRLFVISHPPDGSHIIEVFEQPSSGGLFLPVASFSSPLFQSPNAIVATGPSQFYLVNDKGATNGFERLRETLFRSGLSTVVYFDSTQPEAEQARIVATGIKTGVGLGMSPDGRWLFAAETLGKQIAVFERNAGTGDITIVGHLPTPGSPDNIHVDAKGSLWVAVHPKLLDLVRHFGDADHRSPSLIMQYTRRSKLLIDERGTAPDELLTGAWLTAHFNNGELISAGSVGAVHNDMLLIGSITESHVLQCALQGGLE